MTTKCRVSSGNAQSRTTCFSSFKVTPSQRMPNCVTIDAKSILHCVYTQNSSKTKQNKTKHSRLHYYKNVTIQYRYKLFAHKLARVGNLGSDSVAKCHSNSKRHGLGLPLFGLKL